MWIEWNWIKLNQTTWIECMWIRDALQVRPVTPACLFVYWTCRMCYCCTILFFYQVILWLFGTRCSPGAEKRHWTRVFSRRSTRRHQALPESAGGSGAPAGRRLHHEDEDQGVADGAPDAGGWTEQSVWTPAGGRRAGGWRSEHEGRQAAGGSLQRSHETQNQT